MHPVMRRWTWRETRRLMSTLEECEPDAVLLMYLGGIYNFHPMITFIPTWLKQRRPDTVFVSRFENPLSISRPERTSYLSRIVRRYIVRTSGRRDVSYGLGTLLRDSDHVIALCDYHRELLRGQDARVDEKITVIPPASNTKVVADPDGALRQLGRDRLRADNEEIVIGYMGYVYPNKGVEFLLKAFQRLASERDAVRLTILGGRLQSGLQTGDHDYYDDMQDLARELSIADKVTWTGAFDGNDPKIAEYIHAADFFALPFDNGLHLNNSSFTSLATYGASVISTHGPVLDAALVHEKNVLLCEPKDPDALVKAMISLIEQPELRMRIGRGAAQLASQWFSWDEMIKQTLNTLCPRGHERV